MHTASSWEGFARQLWRTTFLIGMLPEGDCNDSRRSTWSLHSAVCSSSVTACIVLQFLIGNAMHVVKHI